MSPKERFLAFRTQLTALNFPVIQSQHFMYSYYRLVLIRRFTELVISILLIYGGQLFVIQNGFFSPVWAGTGVALAAVFLRGHFVLVGIFLGTLLSYLHNHYSWNIGIIQSGLFTLYIYLIRLCCLKFVGPITPLSEIKVFWKFLTVIVILSVLDISLIYAIFNKTRDINNSFIHFFLTNLWGQLNGILCITPLCLIFEPFTPTRYFQKTNWPWWLSSISIISCQFLYVVFPGCVYNIALFVFFIICFSLSGRKFGQIPTCITLLGVSVIYLGSTTTSSTLFQSTCPPALSFFLLTLICITAIYSATSAQKKS